MLDDGVIRPSSEWNVPLLVVPKKTDASGKKKLRIVVDFRKFNDLTTGDSFPLPNITDILDQLGNAKYFSTLDLASGYPQIPIYVTSTKIRLLSSYLTVISNSIECRLD